MTLPNFLIIGAAKCGTTSLASLLNAHPQASIVQGKESHFFSLDNRYARGIGYYQLLFTHCTDQKAIGDASTSYSRIRKHPKVIERITRHLGQPKIIYMVRNPIERIESAYIEQMRMPRNASLKSINEAVEKIPSMIDSSRYWETYTAYTKALGEKKIKVIWFEEYSNNILGVFKSVCRFLDIDSDIAPKLRSEQKNSRAEASFQAPSGATIDSRWDDETLATVKSALAMDAEYFLKHFNKPNDHWPEIYI